MGKKEQIEAILDYQAKKKAYTVRVTGIDLIPDEVMLTEEQLTYEGISRIARHFEPQIYLGMENCLHCLVFAKRCDECTYSTVLNNPCREAGSLYKKVDGAWDKAREEELKSSCYNISMELRKLGMELKDKLS